MDPLSDSGNSINEQHPEGAEADVRRRTPEKTLQGAAQACMQKKRESGYRATCHPDSRSGNL